MAFVVGVPVEVGTAVVESVVGPAPVWVDADWLAARAAAAIASGAVPLAETVEVAAGVGVTVTVTGSTSATAIGVATVALALVPSCDAGTAESAAEAEVELSPDEEEAVDDVESSCEETDLDRDRGGAFVPMSSVGPFALASCLSDLLAGGFADVLSRRRLLSAADEWLSDQLACAEASCGRVAVLLASAAALLSTRLANAPLASNESAGGRVFRGGAL